MHKLRDLANLLDMDDIFVWDSFVKGTVVIAEAAVYCYPYCAETSPDQNRNHDSLDRVTERSWRMTQKKRVGEFHYYSRAWSGSDK